MSSALLPAHGLTPAEREALAGDGSVSAALAAHGWRSVYCQHGTFAGDAWHEHTHDAPMPAHRILAIERLPNYTEDCVLILAAPSSEPERPSTEGEAK